MKANFFFLTIFFAFSANAMTLTEEGESLILSGIIEIGDDLKIQAILGRNPQIKIFIFENCMGGDVSTGYFISQTVKKKKIDTFIKGQCQSSCAYAFLAGERRRFSSSVGTHTILLHAARNTNEKNDVASVINPPLMRYLSILTDGKLTPEVKILIENSKSKMQGVAFVDYNYFIYKSQRTYYCNGSEDGDLGKCKVLDNANPLALGIVN